MPESSEAEATQLPPPQTRTRSSTRSSTGSSTRSAEHKDQLALLFRIVAVIGSAPTNTRLRRDDISQALDGVPIRTLQRYLNVLKEMALIDSSRGRGSNKSNSSAISTSSSPIGDSADSHERTSDRSSAPGYCLTDEGRRFLDAGLSTSALGTQDVAALAIARAVLAGKGGAEHSAIQAAFSKVLASHRSPRLRDLVQALSEAVLPPAAVADALGTSGQVARLANAAQHQNTILMDYTSQSGGTREWRRVDPYGLELGNRGRVWFLHAWCHKEHRLKTFRLDRMHAIEETGLPFQRREDAWAKFRGEKGVVGGLRGGEPIAVDVVFFGEVVSYARDEPWPEGLAAEPQPDGSVHLTGIALGTEGILVELLRWRSQAVVRGGPELRARIIEELKAMLALYTEDTQEDAKEDALAAEPPVEANAHPNTAPSF